MLARSRVEFPADSFASRSVSMIPTVSRFETRGGLCHDDPPPKIKAIAGFDE